MSEKRTFEHVRQANFQISLRIRAVWSESSLGAFWIANDAEFLFEENDESNQTARMSEGALSHVAAHLMN